MTVLTGNAIRQEIASGKLYIGPILSEKQINATSVDLRMGNIVLLVRAKGLSHVDPRNYLSKEKDGLDLEVSKRQKFERIELPFHKPFMLHPGALLLVPTLEWVRLSPNLMGVVTARSSWAREGLNIATANFIEPDYMGIITMELSNLGQIPIAIYPGLRIAQIAFHPTKGKVEKVKDRQFKLSFEPTAGQIAKDDECFIPTN